MAPDTRLAALRELLDGITASIALEHRLVELPALCRDIGLPAPPEGGTKRERMAMSMSALPDNDLPRLARSILVRHTPGPVQRNELENGLWALEAHPPLPKRTRREISQALDLDDLARDEGRFMAFVDRLWVLDDNVLGVFLGTGESLRSSIQRHVFRFRGDWSVEELFEYLGAFEAGDRRFALMLEGLASADVLLDEAAQRRYVETVNPHLRAVGLELRETDTDGGYPVFSLVAVRAHRGRPKNLVFAVPRDGRKPDIRLADGIDNDIEVVEDADRVLVYDRPITAEGIRWRDLQEWWKDTRQWSDDKEAKDTLYARLLLSLPQTSPPQRALFDLYHRIHGAAVPDLPALLPEVWLHWDPKTVRERGARALLGQRMDFLMLLPGGHRVVLEVDGQHHYAEKGRPSPDKYARMARGDRARKLRGYEVFRFGAVELWDEREPDRGHAHASRTVREFFAELFQRFGVLTG